MRARLAYTRAEGFVQSVEPYHFDLREKATAAGPTPADARGLVRLLSSDEAEVNPVKVVQVGLGALQLGEAWVPVVADVAAWIERATGDDGLLSYRFPMPHTYRLAPPWHSALAQGEAASLLVRAAAVLDRPELIELAERVASPLVHGHPTLVAETPQGPVLQEYPTSPPAHVLNGWITSLWGLYDLARTGANAGEDGTAADAAAAFDAGVDTLVARLYLYDTPIRWSRYDLYPHPVANVASPFYHRLHVGHLRRLNELAPRTLLAETAKRWEMGAASAVAQSFAVSRKILFRAMRPRWRRLV